MKKIFIIPMNIVLLLTVIFWGGTLLLAIIIQEAIQNPYSREREIFTGKVLTWRFFK